VHRDNWFEREGVRTKRISIDERCLSSQRILMLVQVGSSHISNQQSGSSNRQVEFAGSFDPPVSRGRMRPTRTVWPQIHGEERKGYVTVSEFWRHAIQFTERLRHSVMPKRPVEGHRAAASGPGAHMNSHIFLSTVEPGSEVVVRLEEPVLG